VISANLLISEKSLQVYNHIFLSFGDVSMPDVRPQIVHPPKPTTFPSSCQTWVIHTRIQDQGWHYTQQNQTQSSAKNKISTWIFHTSRFGHVSPVPNAISPDISNELLIFFCTPSALLHCWIAVLVGCKWASHHFWASFWLREGRERRNVAVL